MPAAHTKLKSRSPSKKSRSYKFGVVHQMPPKEKLNYDQTHNYGIKMKLRKWRKR
jgi:hypothetical protein